MINKIQKAKGEKVAIITDCHFGIKKNNHDFFLSQKKFFTRQLIPYIRHHEIKKLFILGDVFDSRESINVRIFSEVFKLFLDLSKALESIVIITGNHDIYYKNRTDVNSLNSLEAISNIEVIDTIKLKTIGERKIVFCPWLTEKSILEDFVEQNRILLKNKDVLLLGHLELNGFAMDKINRFSSEDENISLFDNFIKVLTGHFHFRSFKKNIEYIGSPYQLTRIDSNTDRGFVVLDLGTMEEEFIENTESAKFIQIKMKDLLNLENKEVLKGNIIDIFVKENESNSLELMNLIDDLDKIGLLFPVKVVSESLVLGDNNLEIDLEKINTQFDILTILQDYVKEIDFKNKQKVIDKLKELYYDNVQKDATI